MNGVALKTCTATFHLSTFPNVRYFQATDIQLQHYVVIQIPGEGRRVGPADGCDAESLKSDLTSAVTMFCHMATLPVCLDVVTLSTGQISVGRKRRMSSNHCRHSQGFFLMVGFCISAASTSIVYWRGGGLVRDQFSSFPISPADCDARLCGCRCRFQMVLCSKCT